MQMLYRDGRGRPSPEQLQAAEKRQEKEDEKAAAEFSKRVGTDRMFSRSEERRADLHLQLSEKYMIYKDYAERAMINPQNITKGDNRVFYLRPDTIFLEDPRIQNAFRNDFLKQISTPPRPEPFTLLADDFHRAMLEDVRDQSLPTDVRLQMVKFYRRRQYRLQHKRYKYLQRWAHFALTSELVDKVSLKFSPNYSKLQFELENAVKRHQRLDGEDHFATAEKRPQRLENNGDVVRDDANVESLPKQSALRIDDVDVYNRVVTYEQKCSRAASKFVNKAKWAPLTHRFDVYTRHQQYFQDMREEALAEQEAYVRQVQEKGESLIEHRKLGEVGKQELVTLISALPHTKREKKASPLIREVYLAKAKYNYEQPPMILWNQVDLKLSLAKLCLPHKINSDNMEVDNGNSFAYGIVVHFPTVFEEQSLKTQFAYVDSVPTKVNPRQLGKKNMQKVLQRNMKKYGKTTGANTLLELIEIKKEEEKMGIEYINQVERALFGAFNDGQQESIPKVRLAKSTWLDWVCFKPELSKEQLQQAAFLAGERNPADDCSAFMLEILNINDYPNVNLTLESISQIQYEKLKHGTIKSEFLRMDNSEPSTYFTEDQAEFLAVFSSALKTKSELGFRQEEIDVEEVGKNSLYETSQHLLFAHYLLSTLAARESKTKMLYTLNAFRSMQKRLALDLREFGSRDRAMGDGLNLVKPMEKQQITKIEDVSEDEEGMTGAQSSASVSGVGASGSSVAAPGVDAAANAQDIDNIVHDEMVDINRYRHQGRLSNIIYSTCPIVPKYHTTFGEPIERQEVSAEFELTRDADPKKGPAQRLLGRVDKIWLDEANDLYLVTDDHGFNLMYDCAFTDMRALEQEMLKVVSFYINKVEPLQERDLRNVLPSVDRLAFLGEVLHWEELYQRAKLRLCLQYMECYEHTCDTLEQQRLVQIVVDVMAKRPRMNFAANHFKDSYRAEIDALETQVGIMREFIRMQMDVEYRVNNTIREALEKTYRLVYEQMENAWQPFPKGDAEEERNRRQLQHAGGAVDAAALAADKEAMQKRPGMFRAKQAADPMQFAEMLGVPFSSLEMLMKQHHERDPVVKTSLHEHVSFIKIQEGHPLFLVDSAVKAQNKVSLNLDGGRPIGILDFYESLANLPRVVSAIQHCCAELHDVHKPDNGFMSSALDVVSLQFLHAELKAVRAEEVEGDRITSARELDSIADDSIVGNADKMLFHMKELVASIEDPALKQNPFVMTRLDLKTVRAFDFEEYQGLTQVAEDAAGAGDGDGPAALNDSLGIIDTGSDERSLADVYMEGFRQEDSDEEFEAKLQLQQNARDAAQPRLKAKKFRPNIPSLLEIACNVVELVRLRNLLVDALVQREDLQRVYRQQMAAMAKDGRINFKDAFNFSTFLTGQHARWKNFVDSGPGLHTALPTSLAIMEFDPTMTACINFSDPEAFKALLTPLGLEELRIVYRYELTNLNLLVTAVRTNQTLLDNLQRQLAELDLLVDGYAVSNPANKIQQALHEGRYKRLPDDRRNAAFTIQSKCGPHFFNVMQRKQRSRDAVEKLFQRCRLAIVANAGEKAEVLLRQMRTCRMQLAHDYCEEVTGAICLDTLRLELLHEANEMRRRAYLLPKESMVHKLPAALNGEHQCAAYSEADSATALFFDSETRRIQNFWAVPSFQEVFSIDAQLADFNRQNYEGLYQFDLGDPDRRDEDDRPIPPEWADNNQRRLVKARIPKLTPLDMNQADSSLAANGRVADFAECYKFGEGNRVLAQLFYLRQFQNLFDLEFFANKLPSKSYSIAGLEQCVMSGLPFWEDGEDDGEDGGSSGDEYLTNEQVNDPMYADQPDSVDNPHRNQLALKVANRIAEEKRAKMQLLQEIELLKERFAGWERHMRALELTSDVRQAGAFLSELVQSSYYSMLLILMSMQEAHGAAGTALKEMHQVRDMLKQLAHQDDAKVTYTNGFHVNHAVTATHRIALDENCARPDYDNFFKAAQPVIDEAGLNPTEFTLLSGLLLPKYTNNYSYRKDRRYTGHMPKRDYHYLDCKLISIDRDLRKYLTSTLIGVESQAKTYACARLNTSEKQYAVNQNLYREVHQERKVFIKQLIRSKQLRRALMILMSRGPLPVDRAGMKALSAEFTDIFNWKVMTQMDEIERHRQLAAAQDHLKRQKLEGMRGDVVGSTQAMMQASLHKKVDKEHEAILQQYDQATCEVDVYQHEIMNYMILTGKRIVERESDALAKCFELNGKRQQILIHPMQQFASTIDQAIDKKSHLDIVNKVESVQRMLTQFMNRCLPIETLTSGAGFTISAKDLNECMNDLCRAHVKSCEVEMRTRCEQLSMLILQYENLLYTKDMQLLNLEQKLKHAKGELNKIVNTKVFARGNNLIYELDMSGRQLRLLKDNVFSLEKGLKEAVRLRFDKDLEQTRALLHQRHLDFAGYKRNLNSFMEGKVSEIRQNIDEDMRQMLADYKKGNAGQTPTGGAALTSGSPSQSLASISGAAAQQLLDRPNARRKELMDKYAHLLKKTGKGPNAAADISVNLDPFRGANSDHEDNYEVIFEEMERLKESEGEARQQVLYLQKFIRKSRIMNGLKEAVQKQKFDYKMDNMKQQLSSNSVLWEQLAEAEKREQILKQELERSQFEIATQEKMIERLKDDVKAESREKQKLMQYKSNKSKRLDELENKAREFEVLENVDLHKLLGMMERKERRIEQLEKSDLESGVAVDKALALADRKIKQAQALANNEQKVKSEAIGKIMEMRHRQTLLNTEDETLTANFWQDKWKETQAGMSDLREENLILHKVVHEAAQNQMTLQHQVQELASAGSSGQLGARTHRGAAQSMSAIPTPLANFSLSKREGSLNKQSGVPLMGDHQQMMSHYDRKTEEDDFNHKANQSIRRNSMIPKILQGTTNQASMALLEPQRGKPTMLPVIRAKESARAVGAGLGGAAAAAPAQTFARRHRSVDPRTSALMTQKKQQATAKRLNVFQPRGEWGIGASELRYEEQLAGSIARDPSVKFQRMVGGSSDFQATPSRFKDNTPNKMLLTNSTNRSNDMMHHQLSMPFDNNQISSSKNEGTQVTGMTTFHNQNSHSNVFATLSVGMMNPNQQSSQIPMGQYNLSPAPQHMPSHYLVAPRKQKGGSGQIMPQDQHQSMVISSQDGYQKTSAGGSSGLSITAQVPASTKDPVRHLVKVDTAGLGDARSLSRLMKSGMKDKDIATGNTGMQGAAGIVDPSVKSMLRGGEMDSATQQSVPTNRPPEPTMDGLGITKESFLSSTGGGNLVQVQVNQVNQQMEQIPEAGMEGRIANGAKQKSLTSVVTDGINNGNISPERGPRME